MRKRLLAATLFGLSLCIPMPTFAADAPATGDKPAVDKPAADKPANPGPAGGGGGGRQRGPGGGGQGGPGGGGGGFGGGGGGGFGGGGPGGGFGGGNFGGGGIQTMMNVARDPLEEVLLVLGDLNMKADFTLTAEQKTKIQESRDALKVLKDKWQADHEADFIQFQEQMNEIRTAGPGGTDTREKLQGIFTSRQELMETAPKSDETIIEIKGLLTTEQLKTLDARLAARKAEVEKARLEMQDRMRNGFGGQAGGGGSAAGGNANGGGRGQGGGGRGGNGGGNGGGGRGGPGGGGGRGAGGGGGAPGGGI